jgi:hypothetical protein
LEEHFTKKLFGTDAAAMAARNKRAKQLRGFGHNVRCAARDFSGFGYGREYVLVYDDYSYGYTEGRPNTKRKLDSGMEPC